MTTGTERKSRSQKLLHSGANVFMHRIRLTASCDSKLGKYFVPGLLLAFAMPVYAVQQITTAQWQRLTGDKAFAYKNDVEHMEPVKQEAPGAFIKILQALFNFFGSGAGAVLLWGIITCTIVYVVYKLFLSNDSFLFRQSKKMTSGSAAVANDEGLETTNWETLLQNAADNNDLRLAVRYSYMWLLQLLQQRALIQYRNDKTNYEYYTELGETGYKQLFRQLSCQYEYAWYGHFNPSPAAYDDYITLFNSLRKQLAG